MLRRCLWLGGTVFVLLSVLALAGAPALIAAPPAQDGAAAPVGSAADDWARIVQDGLLTIGTAASNPPFEYYDENFQIDGYDAALMRAVAEKLGLKISIVDYPFEGLPAALQMGQIDGIASSLTINAARAAAVDFSMPYYSSSEGVLAAASSPLSNVALSTVDLSNLRVGVQRGTVYEAWAKQALDNGRLAAANLRGYATEGDIVQALKAGQVELGIIDALPAQEFVRQGGVKVVGGGETQQYYGVAVRKGSTLLPQLNLAMTQLQQEGVLEKLRQKHLALDEGAPQPTPAPTPAPPTPGCANLSAYVADVNFDDTYGVPVAPANQPFQKIWRIKNTGTCTWGPGYRLAYFDRPDSLPTTPMGGQPTLLPKVVNPGETVDIPVNMIAPPAPGIYLSNWHMLDAQGQPFGERLWTRIQVSGGGPVAPTPTPGVLISFTADRNSIRIGDCVNFRWDVDGVLAVYFYKDGEKVSDHGVAGHGARQACPQSTTSYNLRVDKRDGRSENRQITIYVQADPSKPQIDFSANPTELLPTLCTNLKWRVTGTVDRITLRRNGENVQSNAPASGSATECPPYAGDYLYELEARGPGGTNKGLIYVTVRNLEPTATATSWPTPTPRPTDTPWPTAEPTPTPDIPTPAPRPPTIDDFGVQPDVAYVGADCINVWWTVSSADAVTLFRNGSPWQDVESSGSRQECPNGPGGISYFVRACSWSTTCIDSDSRYVDVEAMPGPIPTDEPTPWPDPTDEPPWPTEEPEPGPMPLPDDSGG